MTIKVRIMFVDPRSYSIDTTNQLPTVISSVNGLEVPYEKLTLGDLTDRIAETEAHLSRITGLVVRIETGAE